MCEIRLFLKHTLPDATRVEEKPLQNFEIAKQNRGENMPLSITTHTQLKQKIGFTSRATSFMSTRQGCKVTSINSSEREREGGGADLGRGTIFGTLHLIVASRNFANAPEKTLLA
jgi:hypothetical protein